uniref:Serine/arginine-rich splicing factor 12 n=1 Tax=Rhizophora mucronata TaxID=61149 RepID=A0A2P2K5Q2_RHIMU
MFQDILIHAPYPVHALLGIIQVLGLDTALGHTLLPQGCKTTLLPLLEDMWTIQDLLEVLHQIEMATTMVDCILQDCILRFMMMQKICMKMAVENLLMIMRKSKPGDLHRAGRQDHPQGLDLDLLTCEPGKADKMGKLW